MYESLEDLHETPQEKAPLEFTATRPLHLTIIVNEAVKYQQMDGFGASLTNSSAWLLWNQVDKSHRKDVIQMLFSREKGIGLSVLPQPMGGKRFCARTPQL